MQIAVIERILNYLSSVARVLRKREVRVVSIYRFVHRLILALVKIFIELQRESFSLHALFWRLVNVAISIVVCVRRVRFIWLRRLVVISIIEH